MAHCTNCGNRLGPDSRFCSGCGQPVSTLAQSGPSSAPAAPVVSNPVSVPPGPGMPPPHPPQPTIPIVISTPPRRSQTGLVVGLSVGAGVIVLAILAFFLIGGSDTRLIDAHEECKSVDELWTILYATVDEDGSSLYMDGDGDESLGVNVDYQVCVLQALDVPDSVVNRMSNTTSLMGVQTGSWDGIYASWTYHPNNGLDILLELE